MMRLHCNCCIKHCYDIFPTAVEQLEKSREIIRRLKEDKKQVTESMQQHLESSEQSIEQEKETLIQELKRGKAAALQLMQVCVVIKCIGISVNEVAAQLCEHVIHY